ncbi:MAG: PEP-CTERM sorting domain-containing protein [Kiritimatiellae bacterium]|nr:PEP-CTERM sorting domain-containing protein [Kiritimatiellia bacterium]
MRTMLFAILLLAFVMPAGADIILTTVTWTAENDLQNWYESGSPDTNGAAIWTSNVVEGVTNGYLALQVTGTASQVSFTNALVNTNDFSGDYMHDPTNGEWRSSLVDFDFLGYTNSSQFLYIESSWAGLSENEIWSYDFSVTTNAWEHFTVDLYATNGWTQISGSNTWLEALAQVELIGIGIEHTPTGEDALYGLDNWQFQQVPEPGEIALAITALAGMGLFMRRRRKAATEKEESASEPPAA